MLHNDPKWPPPGLDDFGESAVARAFARTARQTYEAFIAEGFTDQQALALVIEIMRQAKKR